MIYSVSGTLSHKEQNFAVVDCGGVGMMCYCSLRTLGKLGQVGSKAFLYTYLNVREDAIELFGFSDLAEQSCFKMLTGVSGVGPKVALGILSELSPERFAMCIAAGDAKSLRQCSGVGPKLAQRILLELKDKIKGTEYMQESGEILLNTDLETGTLAEAVSALAVLGYAKTDAAAALAGSSPEATVEELIKIGLRKLATKL